MNNTNKLVKDVDRCVECGHSGQVDRNGICRVNLNKSRTGLPDRCACKCVSSVSEAEDKNSGEDCKEHRAIPSTNSKATSELKASLSFSDAVKIARGCHDYGGGHHSDGHMEAYQHGIQTVVQALEHAEKDGLQSYQIAVLHSIGSIQDANTAASAGTTQPD